MGVVDEINFIHDGDCKDNTLAIARKYTDKVYVESLTGYPELHMIKALEYVSCSWILKLYADEYLSEDLRGNLQRLVLDDEYDAYALYGKSGMGLHISAKIFHSRISFFESQIFVLKKLSLERIQQMVKKIPLMLEHRPTYNN